MKNGNFFYKLKIQMIQRILNFLFILLVSTIGCRSQEMHRLVPVGKGWAKNTVNAVIFRKNSVVTHKNIQYVSFYDSTSHVVLAKRELGDTLWEVNRTEFTGKTTDAHNTISIMVDGEGYLHLSWDHHDNPLNYSRSVKPGSLTMSDKLPMTGEDERNVSYPEFFKLPGGDLVFMYRSGASGRGNLVMNRYSTSEKKWRNLHKVLIDGEGQRNAYWQAFVDSKGIIHISWVWRETWDVATNHDLCYARSTDGGETWERSTGEKYALPIKAGDAEYAFRIPQKSELINQTSMYADDQSRPYIATYWRQHEDSIPQYRMVYHDGRQWRSQQVSARKTPFSLSGGGTKKIPVSRPQLLVANYGKRQKAIMIFRDAERGSRVSLAVSDNLKKGKWRYVDVTGFSVGDWEPSYDTELWKEQGKLHFFVQRVGQGDGERLESIDAQQVYIIEIANK